MNEHVQIKRLHPGARWRSMQYQRFQYIRDMLKNEGVSLPLPSGN
jgi:hypothetical protein